MALGPALLSLGLVTSSVVDGESAILSCLPPPSGPQICTDGGFNVHNSGSQTQEGPEWAVPPASKATFPVVGNTGGSVLYAAQNVGAVENTLYLMYDWVNSPNVFPGGPTDASFFDVFFQVPSEGDDYVARITASSINVFEKPTGTVSPLNPDGSFDLSAPVWHPLTPQELALARFVGALGFGRSPNDPNNDHIMVEFELSIDQSGTGGPAGFYDPAPAFWSASAGQGADSSFPEAGALALDPPISSAIFTLNPNGSITLTPVFAPGGGPAQQPQDVAQRVPEPATLLLLGLGLAGLGVWARRARPTPRTYPRR